MSLNYNEMQIFRLRMIMIELDQRVKMNHPEDTRFRHMRYTDTKRFYLGTAVIVIDPWYGHIYTNEWKLMYRSSNVANFYTVVKRVVSETERLATYNYIDINNV